MKGKDLNLDDQAAPAVEVIDGVDPADMQYLAAREAFEKADVVSSAALTLLQSALQGGQQWPHIEHWQEDWAREALKLAEAVFEQSRFHDLRVALKRAEIHHSLNHAFDESAKRSGALITPKGTH